MNKRFLYICIALSFLLISLTGCSTKSGNIQSVKDLNRKTLIVESGTSFESYITETGCIESPDFLYAATTADAVDLLITSKGDALIIDKPVGQSLVYKYPQLVMLEDTFDEAQLGFAMPKGSPLESDVNGAIKVLISSGKMDELIKKWMGNDDSLKVIEDQSWDGSRGTILVAVEAGFEPICYLNEAGEPVGLDIDILTQIGKLLNKKVEITVLPDFSMLIPSIEENLFDIAAGGITITEKRLEQVDFSECYYETSSVFIVKDPSIASETFFDEMRNSFRRTFIDNDRWKDILSGLGITVLFIIITGIAGVILGNLMFLFYYFGNRIGKTVMNALDQFFLYVPLSTWLFIAFYLLFRGQMSSPLVVAGFALTIVFAVDVYLNFKDSVGSVDSGQFEAAHSLGYTKYQAYRRLIVPQVTPQILSTLQGDLIMHIRSTSLVGLISAVDIQMVFDIIRSETKDSFIPILFTTLAYVSLGIGFGAIVKSIQIKCDRTGRTPEKIASDIKKGVV